MWSACSLYKSRSYLHTRDTVTELIFPVRESEVCHRLSCADVLVGFLCTLDRKGPFVICTCHRSTRHQHIGQMRSSRMFHTDCRKRRHRWRARRHGAGHFLYVSRLEAAGFAHNDNLVQRLHSLFDVAAANHNDNVCSQSIGPRASDRLLVAGREQGALHEGSK